jgi:glycosyltransferase involved in cell wall biosynthesis
MEISAVIATCNRPDRLLSLLGNLDRSTHPLREVVVVDSSDERLGPGAFADFDKLRVVYLSAPRSVCAQRNVGIRAAGAPWVLLCDDDIEVPPDYLARLAAHATAHPPCGAVSGLWLEKQGGGWSGRFPETSSLVVAWKFLFEMGMWGPIRGRDPLARVIAGICQARGNHIARSGWPVITEMEGAFFRTPIYSLGASLMKRDWLLASPFDESLDSHGLGDNYGVALGFPAEGIHVLNDAPVYHHRSEANRIADGVAQERRMLALDYFIHTRRELADARTAHLHWSLIGAGILHAASGNRTASRAMLRAFARVATGRNPYRAGRGAEPLDPLAGPPPRPTPTDLP